MPPECGDKAYSGEMCQRRPGHAGAHMHFGQNGTTAWGAGVAPGT